MPFTHFILAGERYCPRLAQGEANCRLEKWPRGHTSGHLHDNHLVLNSDPSLKSLTLSLTKSRLARLCFLPLVPVPLSAAIKPLRIFGCILSHLLAFATDGSGAMPPRTSTSVALQEQHLESAGISAAPGLPADTRDMNLRNYSWRVDAVVAAEHVMIISYSA